MLSSLLPMLHKSSII